jgi:hypothetical protein
LTVARASAAEKRSPSTLLPIAVIVAGGVVVTWLIGIGGEFPLSDDWSYAYAVRSLCERGRLELMLAWSGASLVLQAWVGAALCRLFGFSFTVLRAATVVAAVAGAVGFYMLARCSHWRRRRSRSTRCTSTSPSRS